MSLLRYQHVQARVAPEIKPLGITVQFITMGELNNQGQSPEFEDFYQSEIEKIQETLATATLRSDPILLGYRQIHDAIKRSNQRFVAAPENLLSQLLRNHRAPRVNRLVDIYNLVSMKTRLAFGAHDLAYTHGNIELRRTLGRETFLALGAPAPTVVGPGEYGYLDETGEVICRLEVRQCERTKVTPDTTECFYIIQGNPATPPGLLKTAGEELITLTTRFCGGKARWLQTVETA
jgi:DNA/RNA-binding domain of Phe-tRNA-synthetase-like protein